ncbi:MAG: flagellar protein FlaG [Nevskia sp.]|nr:flagellar protein FlaG [Nevskia sp.]
MADSIAGIAGMAGVIPSLVPPGGAAGTAGPAAGVPAPVADVAQAAAAAAAQKQQAAPDLHDVASALNQYAQDMHTSLHFQVDHTTGQLVISVIDTQTNQVLMQVPNEEALAIAQSLAHMQAQLLQRKA